jgi:putative SOS response-associated peptidase YedK
MKQYHHAMAVVLEDKDLQKTWLLEGGMDLLRDVQCNLYGEHLSDKIEAVYST